MKKHLMQERKMLEKMKDFFENRLDGYDEHMRKDIAFANEFYPYTAKQLPTKPKSHILDLGCGTGLELEEYFKLNPNAIITGIDLSEKMLQELQRKFPTKTLHLISDSYFDVDLGNQIFDGAVSVESLHHFSKEEKVKLYKKLHRSLKDHASFILTDYFALSDEEEQTYQNQFQELKEQQKIEEGQFYHFDIPLTVEHEMEALLEAGFSEVKVLKQWQATCTIQAVP